MFTGKRAGIAIAYCAASYARLGLRPLRDLAPAGGVGLDKGINVGPDSAQAIGSRKSH